MVLKRQTSQLLHVSYRKIKIYQKHYLAINAKNKLNYEKSTTSLCKRILYDII